MALNHQDHPDHDDDHHEHGSELSEMQLRVRALETVLAEKGYFDPAAIDVIIEAYETKVGPHVGARVVAKAWSNLAFKEALLADASKPKPAGGQVANPVATAPLFSALVNFSRNAIDFTAAKKDYIEAFGDSDVDALNEHLAKKVQLRPAAGYVEGLQATVAVIKANEALLTGRRVAIKPELFELA